MITFKNPGLIDLNAIRMMGVSIKETSSPIGFFGTGLKYAIAITLRTGGSITIYRGLDKYEFSSRSISIRGKAFQAVFMNEEQLPFTLEYGKKWQPWMAFRELESNVRDEHGLSLQGREEPSIGTTTIHVEGLDEVYSQRRSIFIESTPIWKNAQLEVHAPTTANSIYFRGVRVATPAGLCYNYNFHDHLELTEDRTVAEYHFRFGLVWELLKCSDAEILRCIFRDENRFEWKMDWGLSSTISPTLLKLISKGLYVPPSLFSKYCKQVGRKRAEFIERFTPTPVQQKAYERAAACVKNVGFDPSAHEVIFCRGLINDRLLGLAEDEKIFLSERVFEQGTKQIAATLLEEIVHLERGLFDYSLAMQTFLFDKIISLAEELSGEPL